MIPASFKDGSFGRISRLFVGTSIAAILAFSGQASANHDDFRCNLVKPIRSHSHGHGHGHGYKSHRSRSSVSISIGSSWSNCDSGVGFGYSYGRGYRHYDYRPYCPPVVTTYCPPPQVIVTNPCPPTVVYTQPSYVYERRVVVERPVEVQRVVERPVYVDRVVERPVIVERPVEKVVEKVVYVDPSPSTAPAAGGYRDRELGDAYMRMSDWSNAVRVYNRYLSAWDKDGTATRNLGLAQIGAGATAEGFRNVVAGYQLESGLLDRPLRISDFGGPSGLEQLIDASVRGADSTNAAQGWFTVAVLQSIAGQNDAAINSVKRARDAGLNADLLDKLTLRVSGAGS